MQNNYYLRSMRIYKTLFLTILVTPVSSTMEVQNLSSSIATFSAKFCNELDKTQSVVSSPLSAEFLLALLTLGAEGPTHTELLSSLGISGDDQIRSSFTSLSQKLHAIRGVRLNVANKVYIKEGDYDLNENLKKDAVSVFNAALEKVDFTNSAAATSLINKWVENQTNNKIKDLLSSDSVNEDTRIVLVNAIYFKGTWKKKFDPANTMDQLFYTSPSVTVEVPMMYQESEFYYGESEALQAQLLRLQYVEEDASMVIVLPKQVDGLDAVLERLAAGHDLLQDLQHMHEQKVQVTLPKFKIETEIDLADLLPKLGIKSIFSPLESGLSKVLSAPEALFVSKAVQKAFIEVNEEGAEAAAASGMVLMMRCMPRPAPRFRADRPFAFVLVSSDGAPVFHGALRGRSL